MQPNILSALGSPLLGAAALLATPAQSQSLTPPPDVPAVAGAFVDRFIQDDLKAPLGHIYTGTLTAQQFDLSIPWTIKTGALIGRSSGGASLGLYAADLSTPEWGALSMDLSVNAWAPGSVYVSVWAPHLDSESPATVTLATTNPSITELVFGQGPASAILERIAFSKINLLDTHYSPVDGAATDVLAYTLTGSVDHTPPAAVTYELLRDSGSVFSSAEKAGQIVRDGDTLVYTQTLSDWRIAGVGRVAGCEHHQLSVWRFAYRIQYRIPDADPAAATGSFLDVTVPPHLVQECWHTVNYPQGPTIGG